MSSRLFAPLVLGLAVLATGPACSLTDRHQGKGEPVQLDLKADKVPAAKRPGSVEAALRDSLEREVLTSAGKTAPVESTCQPVGPQHHCTVTYAGTPVRFKVTVTSPPNAASLFTYKVDERQALVTRHAVHLAVLKKIEGDKAIGKQWQDPRCDAGIPEVAVYPDDTRTDHYCYLTPPGKATERFRVLARQEVGLLTS